MDARIASIRRYPVKSMGGEDLDRVAIDARGLAGDRWFAVVDDDGRLASGKDSRRFRRRDRVFDYAATTDASGAVAVTGRGGRWSVGEPALDAELSATLGASVRVLAEREVQHHDGGAVSIVGTATLAWCASAWGVDADPRRLRASIVVETRTPFVEETWMGRTLDVGSARLAVVEPIPRCRTIDLAQDGASDEGRWLAPLGRERDLCLAVYADVETPGVVAVGDAVVVR